MNFVFRVLSSYSSRRNRHCSCFRRIAGCLFCNGSGAPFPPAYFGSLRDLIGGELEYEASTEYLDDQAYWPRTSAGKRTALSVGTRGRRPRMNCLRLSRRFNWTLLPLPGSKELSRGLGGRADRRCLPRRARCWCVGATEGSEVVLDFPVSRRVQSGGYKTVPGMVTGFVPLVLKASPESTVAGFSEHVDTRNARSSAASAIPGARY